MLFAIFRRIEEVACLKVIADPIAGDNVWILHADPEPFSLEKPSKIGGVVVRDHPKPTIIFYWYVDGVAEAMFTIFPTHYHYRNNPLEFVPGIVGVFMAMHPRSETIERSL